MADIERLSRPEREAVVFVVYRFQEKKFLLEQVANPNSAFYGYTIFPGGKIEVGELASQALVREVSEELGVKTACFLKLDSFEDMTLNKHHTLLHAFLVVPDKGEKVTNREPHKSRHKWLSARETDWVLTLASSRLVFVRALQALALAEPKRG